jgi:hypothetical protein
VSIIDGTTINSGIVFGTVASAGTYTSPLTVTADAVITAPSNAWAIYGPATQAWTIDNSGTVGSTNRDGIYLGNGGLITNQASGTIQGQNYGICSAL